MKSDLLDMIQTLVINHICLQMRRLAFITNLTAKFQFIADLNICGGQRERFDTTAGVLSARGQ